MKRTASVEWIGNLKDGRGKIAATQSGVLSNTPYSFRTRFGDQVGTNPEELIAAAHAGCFAMALSAELEKRGLVASLLRADAEVTLAQTDGAWAISAVALHVFGRVPGATPEAFAEAAKQAKENCPVSRLLRAPISLDAELLLEEAPSRAVSGF